MNVLPGGVAVLDCSTGNDTSTMVGYDLITGKLMWKYAVPSTDTIQFGTQHIFVLAVTNVAATGLADAYLRYAVTAVSFQTGNVSWTVPLEEWVPTAGRHAMGSTFYATEGPSGLTAPFTDVVISLNGTTALDSATGAELWHTTNTYTTDASGNYVTSGIVEGYDTSHPAQDASANVAGLFAATGKPAWKINYPAWLSEVDTQDQIYGDIEIHFASGVGYIEYDVATGQVIDAQQFPASWTHVYVIPGFAVANVSGQIALFKLPNLTSPVWAIPAATDVQVAAMSAGHILLSAQSGFVLVSTMDGSTTATLPSLNFNDTGFGQLQVTDGEANVGTNATVFELDPPVGR